MFHRKIHERMKAWKAAGGRTALFLGGAPGVGKTTAAKAFAGQEYENHIFIDFFAASPEVLRLFDDLTDSGSLRLRLQLFFHVRLEPGTSAVIFDNVPCCPRARKAARLLAEECRLSCIMTGTPGFLSGNVKDVPGGETRLKMFPMDFEEFCTAADKAALPPLLRTLLAEGKPPSDGVHRKLLQQFAVYMLVGGMPRAVAAYLETNDLLKVETVKRSILGLWKSHLGAIDAKGRAERLFRAIPAQLKKNASRFQVSCVLRNHRAADISGLISAMQDAGMVLAARHADDPGAGIEASLNPARFRLFLADTGLLLTLASSGSAFRYEDTCLKLLSGRPPVGLGYLFENVTAQMLAARGYGLAYHAFPRANPKLHYKVDFLLPEKGGIVPVEVRGSGYLTHAALDAFAAKFPLRTARRLLVGTKNLQNDGGVLCLPVYLVPFLREMLQD